MRRALLLLALLVSACPAPTTTTNGGEGGQGGDGGAGGAPVTTSAPCVCDPIPATCVDPASFTMWCSHHGPGPYPALRCKGCGSDCTEQAAPVPECLGAPLWCCEQDFNPPPIDQPFKCVGEVACESAPDIFDVFCDYDQTVNALDATSAALELVADCEAKNPGLPCGLWTLRCTPL